MRKVMSDEMWGSVVGTMGAVTLFLLGGLVFLSVYRMGTRETIEQALEDEGLFRTTKVSFPGDDEDDGAVWLNLHDERFVASKPSRVVTVDIHDRDVVERAREALRAQAGRETMRDGEVSEYTLVRAVLGSLSSEVADVQESE